MNFGPNYLYTEAMNECAVCNVRLREVPALGIYMVGNRGGIHYPLCSKCIKTAQKGFPPDVLRRLDCAMEKRAVELGLTSTQ